VGHFGFVSLLPFSLALFFLIWKEDVVFPVLGGLFIGSIIASKLNPYHGFMNLAGSLITSALLENRNLLTLLIISEALILYSILSVNGSLSVLMRILSKRFAERRRLEILVAAANLVIFLDRHFAALLVGMFTRPFAEKRKLHPVKHAYLLNTVSSGLSTLVPLSTLMPFVFSGVGTALAGIGMGYSPLKAFYHSIPYQYYNIFSLFIVASTILLDKDIFLMRRYAGELDRQVDAQQSPSFISFGCSSIGRKSQDNQKLAFIGMAASLALVFAALVGSLLMNRAGIREQGVSGAKGYQVSFVTALFTGIIFSLLFSFATKSVSYRELREKRSAVPKPLLIAFLSITLAFAAGGLADRLNLANSAMAFLAGRPLRPGALPLIVFLFSSLVSFLSGSTPLTITAVMPIAVRLVSRNMTDPLIVEPLLFAAIGSVLSGASFGDMNSPFSVTFLISTASAETSVSSHFKSQAGYSLLAFAATIVAGYLLLMLGIKPYLSIAAGALLIGLAFLGLNRTK